MDIPQKKKNFWWEAPSLCLAIVQCLAAEHGADVQGHGMVLNVGGRQEWQLDNKLANLSTTPWDVPDAQAQIV